MSRFRHILVIALVCVSLAACQGGIPKDALELSPESLQQRQQQTRRFDTKDEAKLLVAGSQVLQDLGFTLDDSETKLGLINASKDRSAVEAGQVALSFLAALGGKQVPFDEKQKIRVSFITSPLSSKETLARVTFQRVVWNSQGQVTKSEALDAPQLYQEFFSKLSQSIFLTANEI